MLDINLIREKPDLVREALEKRQEETAPVDRVLDLDEQRRELIQEVEALRAERNKASKEISRMEEGEARQEKIEAMRLVAERISILDGQLGAVEAELDELMSNIPNIPDARVPLGVDESENVVIKTVGEFPEFDFVPKPHWDLGPELGVIDFERGVKITGSRFYVLSGLGARLQRALISWMIDLHNRQGYTEKYPPFMVRAIRSTGRGSYPNSKGTFTKTTKRIFGLCPQPRCPSRDCTWTKSWTGIPCPDTTPPTRLVSGARR